MTRRFDPRKMRDWRTTERKSRSPAQEAATARNFQIVRLRGLWFAVGLLGGWRARSARALVDDALKELGAEPQGARLERERTELEVRLAAERQTEIPF